MTASSSTRVEIYCVALFRSPHQLPRLLFGFTTRMHELPWSNGSIIDYTDTGLLYVSFWITTWIGVTSFWGHYKDTANRSGSGCTATPSMSLLAMDIQHQLHVCLSPSLFGATSRIVIYAYGFLLHFLSLAIDVRIWNALIYHHHIDNVFMTAIRIKQWNLVAAIQRQQRHIDWQWLCTQTTTGRSCTIFFWDHYQDASEGSDSSYTTPRASSGLAVAIKWQQHYLDWQWLSTIDRTISYMPMDLWYAYTSPCPLG